MKEPIKIHVEFSVLYKTLLMVEMRSKIFKEAQYKFWKLLTSFLWPCKVIENRKLCLISFLFWFLLHWNFYASVIHLSFWKIMHMWLLIDHCIVVCAVIVVFTLCYICDDFNDKYFISIIAHSGDYRDVHALIGQGLHHILL